MRNGWVLQGARAGLTSAGNPHDRELIGEFPTWEAAFNRLNRLSAPRFIKKGRSVSTEYQWKWMAITRRKGTPNAQG